MNLVWAHLKAETLALLRVPGYLVPTVVLPSMLFLFFGVPNAHGREAASFLMASYLMFAVVGVAFFQFGVGIAQDRVSPWETYLRTLPVPPRVRVAARLLSALCFAAAASAVVIVVAHLLTPAGLETGRWLRLGVALLAGSIPFGLIGIALGYWASPKTASPIANLLWLPLAFLGGFWVPPDGLPALAAALSPYTPTRRWGENRLGGRARARVAGRGLAVAAGLRRGGGGHGGMGLPERRGAALPLTGTGWPVRWTPVPTSPPARSWPVMPL